MACNCNEEGKIINIGMGCCVPVVANADAYYTKSEIDEKLEDIVSSGCCITPEEVDEKISAATDGYATEQWVLDQNYISGVDLSDYALKSEIPTVPTNVSAFVNDVPYLTEHQSLSAYSTTDEVTNMINQSVSGKQDTLIAGQNITISGNVISAAGGSGTPITVDDAIDSGSTNPVENRVIYNALQDKADKSEIPTVPTSNSAFTNDAGYLTEHQPIKTINGNVLVGTGNVQLDIPKIWHGTKAEYELIQNKDAETIYLVYEN